MSHVLREVREHMLLPEPVVGQGCLVAAFHAPVMFVGDAMIAHWVSQVVNRSGRRVRLR